ncbi:MFS transporter [Acidimangrovimonas sediminis]|uniref:MFS transporter n=1 Tax=Acidimangrovimonas sediminis TaxID=2056283 RepID=UPI000C8002B8|nr:MFS transporter [Acidimangrovimonas sediminis]
MTALPRYLLARFASALALFSALLGSTAPSPLYPIYIDRFGLSHFMATAIFAVYAIGTLGALAVVPRIMRYFGDRCRILMVGLALTAAGTMLFAVSSVEWTLFLGRFLNGAGTGVVAGVASTALVELAPAAGRRLAATLATLAFTGGAASGPLITSAALALNLAPTVTPFLVIAVIALAAFLGLLLSRWPGADEIAGRDAPAGRAAEGAAEGTADDRSEARPDAASEAASDSALPGLFVLSCLAITIAWMIGSVLMAVGANLGLEVYRLASASVAGLIPALFQLFAGLGQAVCGRYSGLRTVGWGALGIVLAQVTLVLAAPGAHGAVLVFAMPFCGFAYGAAFVGGLSLASATTDPDRRASRISRFYTVGYLSNAVPTVSFGILTDAVGLANAFYIFSAVLIALGLTTLGYAARYRLNGTGRPPRGRGKGGRGRRGRATMAEPSRRAAGGHHPETC